uniref:Uncharacterized protein n=1 Tax=Anguilla anguilla TaxID=7936 RepID=A0A0E9XUL8_ANGAN
MLQVLQFIIYMALYSFSLNRLAFFSSVVFFFILLSLKIKTRPQLLRIFTEGEREERESASHSSPLCKAQN